MRKEIPESSWVDYLMQFAKENEGKQAEVRVDFGGEKNRLLGQDALIAFEGDCDGEIVNGVKVVLGGEGDGPDNIFHRIGRPTKLIVYEREDGTVEAIELTDDNNQVTAVKIVEQMTL